MKVLTLTQPWATLMALGIKTIETRSWKTNYRGTFAIHAAKGFPRWAQDLAKNDFYSELALHLGDSRDMAKDLPRGEILCTVNLVDCISTNDVRFIDQVVGTGEFDYGDYSQDRYAFVTDDLKLIEPPVPARGALSFWNTDLL